MMIVLAQLCRAEDINHCGQLMICDATGVSTSAAVLIFSLLVCEQVGILCFLLCIG